MLSSRSHFGSSHLGSSGRIGSTCVPWGPLPGRPHEGCSERGQHRLPVGARTPSADGHVPLTATARSGVRTSPAAAFGGRQGAAGAALPCPAQWAGHDVVAEAAQPMPQANVRIRSVKYAAPSPGSSASASTSSLSAGSAARHGHKAKARQYIAGIMPRIKIHGMHGTVARRGHRAKARQ